MQNSLWKLTALAGVVGIGFLAVLQAQQGLKKTTEDPIAALVENAEPNKPESSDPPQDLADAGGEAASMSADADAQEPFAASDSTATATRSSGSPFDAEPSGSFGNEPTLSTEVPMSRAVPRRSPMPRGLNFNEEPTPTREAAPELADQEAPTGEMTDELIPVAEPRRRAVTPVAGEESPTPVLEIDVPRANVVPADREEPALLEPEPSQPAARNPGPKLVIPTGGDDSDAPFFGDDLPSQPSVRSAEPTPANQEPEELPPSRTTRPRARSAAESPAPSFGDFPEDSRPMTRGRESVPSAAEPTSAVEPALGDDPFGTPPARPAADEPSEPGYRRTREPSKPTLDPLEPEPASSPSLSPASGRPAEELDPLDPLPNPRREPSKPRGSDASEFPFNGAFPELPGSKPMPRATEPEPRSVPREAKPDRSSSEGLPGDGAFDPLPREREPAQPSLDPRDRRDPSPRSPMGSPLDEPAPDRPMPRGRDFDSDFPDRDAPRTRPTMPREEEPAPRNPTPRRDDFEPGRSTQDPPSRSLPSREPLERPRDVEPLPRQGATPDRPELVGDGTIDNATPKGPQRPQLRIEKQAPPNAVLGQPMVYHILIKNMGETAAHDVIVEDRIPKGTEMSGSIPRAELIDKTLVWKLGTMQPGEEKKIAVRVTPLSEGQIGSVTTVNFVAEVGAKTVITAPRLQFDLTGPAEARAGESVPFVFRLKNAGSADAKGVVLRNLVPGELRHVDGNDLEYEIGTLPAGQSREVKLTLTAVKAGNVLNRAVATAEGGVSVEATARIEIHGPALSLSRTGPKRVSLGRQALFTTTVSNDSDRTVEGATIVEVIPAGLEVLEASPQGQLSADRRTLSWRMDRFQPGQSAELKVKFVAKATGAKLSRVHVVESGATTAEVSSETDVVGAANLSADIATGGGPLGVGDRATFRLVVRNRGNDSASNVRIRLTLPEEVEFVSSDSRGALSADGRELTFPAVDRLEPGRDTSFQVVLKAARSGDIRLVLHTDADDMQRPLLQEEQIVILPAE